MVQLPNEILLYIQNILIKNRELRTYANMCKAFNWDIDMKYFECELRNSRNYRHRQDYDTKMIELWERTGIDDGVPEAYIKKRLNNKTRLFKTMWALHVCSGNFFDMIKWYGKHNKYVKYTDNILIDNRRYNKSSCDDSLYRRPCKYCWQKYKNELVNSTMNITGFEYRHLPVHEDNVYLLKRY